MVDEYEETQRLRESYTKTLDVYTQLFIPITLSVFSAFIIFYPY